MDSEPRPSPDGARSFGDRLATRVRLRGRASGSVVRRSVGGLAVGATRFGRSVGLSQVGRWGLDRADGADVDQLAVRPPIEYWPWPQAAAEGAPSADVVEGDPKLAALAKLVGRAPHPAARVPSPPQRPRRGLPLAASRRGSTTAGPSTSPGAIAAGLRATLDPTPPAEPAVRRRERRSDPGGRAGAGDPQADALPPDLAALRGRARPNRPGAGAAEHVSWFRCSWSS